MAAFIILFAFMVSVSRMLIPLLSDYRENFELVAAEQLGRKVTIGKIDAEWIGFWPRIHLVNIGIQSKEGDSSWLTIKDAWVSVDILSLMQNGQVDAERIKVGGVQLSVHRKNEKEYVINNELFQAGKSDTDYSILVNWLFSRDRLQLFDSTLSYSDYRYENDAAKISRVNFSLENNEQNHHAFGRLNVQGKRVSQLSFVLDLQGDILKPQEIISDFYIRGDVYASRTLKQWAKPYVKLEDSDFFIELWGKGKLNQLDEVKARFNAERLKWSLVSESESNVYSDVENITGQVFWLKEGNGWSLDVEDFSLKHAGKQWPVSDMHFSYKKEDQGVVSLEGSAAFIRLQDLGQVVSSNLPDSLKIKHKLNQLKISGDLSDVDFAFRGTNDYVDQFYFSANLQGLGYGRLDGFPGVANIDGKVLATKDKGVIKLNSNNAVLDFGELFPKPLKVNELKGNVYWQKKNEELAVSFDDLALKNNHVQGNVRAMIRLPDDAALPFMDMQIDFKNGQAEYTHLYIPRILGEGSQAWLDRAFVSGQIAAGKMLYHGNIADYPFDNNKGTFIVDFDVSDLVLKYGQAWPVLKKMDANILFKDDSLTVKVKKAELMGLETSESLVHIDGLNAKTVLTADMKFDGKLKQLLQYMHDSPIGDGSRDFLKEIKAKGLMSTSVFLRMPLTEEDVFYLKGKTEFKNNKFVLEEWHQTFDEIKGGLHYVHENDNFEFSSNSLTTRFHGKPAELDVKTIANKKNKRVTIASLTGRFPTASLLSPTIKASHFVKGESDWKIDLNIHKKKRTSLQVTSDLKGTSIALPDGFSKSSEIKRPIHFQLNMLNGDKRNLYFSMGKKLKSAFRFNPGGSGDIYNGEISFGNSRVAIPKSEGIKVKGYLNTLSLNKWADVFPSTNKVRLRNAKVLESIDSVNLSLGKIKSGDHAFNKVELSAESKNETFDVKIDSPDISGLVQVPYIIDAESPIVFDLKYLTWGLSKDKSQTQAADPRLLPSLDIKINKFVLDKKLFGQVKIKARDEASGLYIDELILTGPSLNVNGHGSWLFNQSWHESDFSLKLNAPSVKSAVSLFDVNTSVEEGALDAQIQASWAGPPHWFEMKRLNGNIHLVIKNGRLSEVDPGGGRIFGLLNIKTVLRRLTLDFNDLLKKGFGFDKIMGNFNIAEGDAYTNDLLLDGPAAKIEIAGRIGLAAEDYDQVITVTPKLSSTLPLLGLAAGPQVAVGLLLTEKLFRKRINKISVSRYTVTGSWDKPVVQKIKQKPEQKSEPEFETE